MTKPTLFVLDREELVITGYGHTYHFKPGEPVMVSPVCHSEVLKLGARAVESDAEVQHATNVVEQEPSGPPDPVARKEAIKDAIRSVVVRNEPYDFGANGRPKVGPVTDAAGFKVAQSEIMDAWEEVRAET